MNWEQKPLGELLEALIDHRGRTPKKLGTDFVANGVPVLSAQLVTNGFIDWSKTRFVDQQTFELWMPQKLKKSDVLLTSEAPLGRTAILNREQNVVLGQRLFALRGKKGVLDNHYLHYWLRSDKGQAVLTSHAQGTTVIGIRQSSLRSISVDLPSITTQKAIADVLGALDDKIAANIRVKETCTELIKAIGSIPNSNIPVSELAVQVKKQISAVKLQELDVRHYSIPAFDLGYASIESGDEIKSGKNLIEAPCVLVSKLNPRTPRIWSIPTLDSEETTVCSTEFIAWQGTTVPQAALYAALLQGSFSEQLQERASGTSNSHQRVRPQDIQEATIPDVRKLDQETLKLLEALNLQAADLIKENQALARTRDELLPLLMNGKITVAEAKEAAGDVGVVKQNKQEEGDGSV